MNQQSLEIILNKAQKGEVKYIAQLMAIGREKGFESFINRKLIWPFLLGLDAKQFTSSIYQWDGQMDHNSFDYEQLQKDAQRSLASMKTFDSITKFHLQKRQQDVLKILDSFFAKHTDLRYIQGFHDIASIFIVLFGNSSGYYMMEKAGKTYFRDFLTKDIGTLSLELSQLVLELLLIRDPSYQQIFQCFSDTRLLMFIIPWVLTWFSHVFSSVKIICRIWDYLLCTGPQGIIYLTAGVILVTKDELISSNQQIDQAAIHTFYQQKVKSESIDIEKAIQEAIELQKKTNIQDLPYYEKLDPASILLNQNFELKIDLHRQVREYIRSQERNANMKKKMIATAVFVIFAGSTAAFYFLRHGKKLGIGL